MKISHKLNIFLADKYNEQLINDSKWEELFIQMYKFKPSIENELIECIIKAGIMPSNNLIEIATIAKNKMWENLINNVWALF